MRPTFTHMDHRLPLGEQPAVEYLAEQEVMVSGRKTSHHLAFKVCQCLIEHDQAAR